MCIFVFSLLDNDWTGPEDVPLGYFCGEINGSNLDFVRTKHAKI